jgi:hypothetical protein
LTTWLLLTHLAATWYLVGLCWLVQRVQYPLMALVGRASFPIYEAAHVDRIGPVVAPVMLVELVSGGLLWAIGGEAFRHPIFVAALTLIAVIWLSTFIVQVPLHDLLGRGFDPDHHAALVRTNWIRTLVWSARGVLLLGWLGCMMELPFERSAE